MRQASDQSPKIPIVYRGLCLISVFTSLSRRGGALFFRVAGADDLAGSPRRLRLSNTCISSAKSRFNARTSVGVCGGSPAAEIAAFLDFTGPQALPLFLGITAGRATESTLSKVLEHEACRGPRDDRFPELGGTQKAKVAGRGAEEPSGTE
jgi:hypothetical protein